MRWLRLLVLSFLAVVLLGCAATDAPKTKGGDIETQLNRAIAKHDAEGQQAKAALLKAIERRIHLAAFEGHTKLAEQLIHQQLALELDNQLPDHAALADLVEQYKKQLDQARDELILAHTAAIGQLRAIGERSRAKVLQSRLKSIVLSDASP